MRRLELLGLRQNEQRTWSCVPTVRLTETCGVGLGLLSESDVEVSMTSSMEPNAPLVNRRRYERKLWMRDLVMGVAYPPVDP